MNSKPVRMRRERIVEAVASAIAQARRRSGLTQAQVAEAIGIGPEAVSRLERGAIEPTITRLIELAEVFGCGVGDLLVPGSDLEADQARVIAHAMKGLETPDRQHLLELATMVADHLRIRNAKRNRGHS